MAGDTIGPYRVLRDLGQGGMGAVYLVEVADPSAGRPLGARFALKVIHPHLLASTDLLERFRKEAEIGMRVAHENVVRCLGCEAFEIERVPSYALVMEYVEGQTLRGLLTELGRVPEELCRHVGHEIACGLEAIHEVGVIHRDVKPENVLITREHQVKVMDLGVARLLDEAERLTQTGQFVGSFEYAAPEQFQDAACEPDERADLHALGAVLYELATGHHPFRAESLHATLLSSRNWQTRRSVPAPTPR